MPRTEDLRSAAGGAETPAVELKGLRKAFGSCRANEDVNLSVRHGSIHGVIGENGAGKSTAMKMLYGIHRPDGGSIRVHGKEHKWGSPMDAIAAGIGMVHQHFMLAGPHSALDNILLGAEPAGKKWQWLPRAIRPIDRSAAREKLQYLADQYGLQVDWDSPVETLSVGIQQRIEILKILYREARILILDEPTAVLTPQETGELFSNLRRLRDEGKTILIITHKLKEVMSLTDRVTVFRAGRVTGEVETKETSEQALADLMVGRKVALRVSEPPPAKTGEIALKLRSIFLEDRSSGGKPILDLTIEVRKGEVVGIAGVEGNGQSELLQVALHPDEYLRGGNSRYEGSGSVEVLGRDVTHCGADEIKALGVGWIPEDRHKEALLLDRPLRENFLLGLHTMPEFSSRGIIRKKALEEAVIRALESYDVRPRDPDALAGGLSGGNQQKLIIAREFERRPRLLVCAQPTRGVDVGAIEFIHERILEARTSGAAVLLVSSELDEVLALSDRVLVMYEGRITAEFKRGQTDERVIGIHMGGGGSSPTGAGSVRSSTTEASV